jgi:hypothetical protein
MVAYPHRPQSGHITCYLNRTYHVLPTAEITFVDNHAFPSEKLREQFPLKRGDLFERGKVAGGSIASANFTVLRAFSISQLFPIQSSPQTQP